MLLFSMHEIFMRNYSVLSNTILITEKRICTQTFLKEKKAEGSWVIIICTAIPMIYGKQTYHLVSQKIMNIYPPSSFTKYNFLSVYTSLSLGLGEVLRKANSLLIITQVRTEADCTDLSSLLALLTHNSFGGRFCCEDTQSSRC